MTQPALRNIVLVHGAFTDAHVWAAVIARLQARRFTVSAVQLPLSGLAEDVAATRRVLARQDGPCLLAGHSWGGAVISAAGLAPQVRALAYVSALAPAAGESVADLQRHGPAAPGMQGARPDAEGLVWFDPASYGPALAADLPAAQVGVLAATQRPIAAASFAAPLATAAWTERPCWSLISTEDQALSPALQRFMAGRLRARITETACSHMSPLARPDAVAALLEAAAAG